MSRFLRLSRHFVATAQPALCRSWVVGIYTTADVVRSYEPLSGMSPLFVNFGATIAYLIGRCSREDDRGWAGSTVVRCRGAGPQRPTVVRHPGGFTIPSFHGGASHVSAQSQEGRADSDR